MDALARVEGFFFILLYSVILLSAVNCISVMYLSILQWWSQVKPNYFIRKAIKGGAKKNDIMWATAIGVQIE